MLTILGVFLGIFGASNSAWAKVAPADRIQVELQRLVLKPGFETGNAVGMSALYFDGKKESDWSIGKTNLQLELLPDAQTFFEIGSITKIFTTQIYAQLEVEGLISETTTVADIFQELRGTDAGTFTLRSLAQHRSGLPKLPKSCRATSNRYQPYSDYSNERFWQDLKAYKFSDSEPGYSNWGMALLGKALEKISGQSYYELLQKRIFKPLHLEKTKLNLSHYDMRNVAQGYSSGLEAMDFWHFGQFEAAGALKSNSQDMMKFAKSVLRSPSRHMSRTFRHQIKNELGWQKTIEGTLWHNGATGGYTSLMLVDLKSNRALVVLSNTENGIDDACLIQAFEGKECTSFKETEFSAEISQRIPGCYTLNAKSFVEIRSIGRVSSLRFISQGAGSALIFRRLYRAGTPAPGQPTRLAWATQAPSRKSGVYLEVGAKDLSVIYSGGLREESAPLVATSPAHCLE